jgi:hypothetical protein
MLLLPSLLHLCQGTKTLVNICVMSAQNYLPLLVLPVLFLFHFYVVIFYFKLLNIHTLISFSILLFVKMYWEVKGGVFHV